MAFIPKTWVDDQIVYAEDMNRIEKGIAETDALLREKSNPNLLDNWYFADPIDQRGGYVIPPGVVAGEIFTANNPITTDKYYAVKRFEGSAPVFDYNGVEYTTDANTAVRGYTGAGYGIDRWNQYVGTTLLAENGIVLISPTITDPNWKDINQFLSDDLIMALRGKEVTISCLVDVDTLVGGLDYVTLSNNTKSYFDATDVYETGLQIIQRTFTVPNTWEKTDQVRFTFGMYVTEGRATLIAAKLELGSQQTLAHQDESGNWVLNDLPNKALELAKCQRYYQRFKNPTRTFIGIVNVSGTDSWVPVHTARMRAIPSVNIHNMNIYDVKTNLQYAVSSASCQYMHDGYPTLTVSADEAIPAGSVIMLNTEKNGFFEMIADL